MNGIDQTWHYGNFKFSLTAETVILVNSNLPRHLGVSLDTGVGKYSVAWRSWGQVGFEKIGSINSEEKLYPVRFF